MSPTPIIQLKRVLDSELRAKSFMKERKDGKRQRYLIIICPICQVEREVRYSNYTRYVSDYCRKCYEQENMRTHGKSQERVYRIWKHIKQRCSNPKNENYMDYGGRGISVCTSWWVSFVNFYEWAMENGYANNLEIDRIDNNGNYEPENCRWITHAENMENRKR